MLPLPRAGWLAVGAIMAALLWVDRPLPSSAVTLLAAGVTGVAMVLLLARRMAPAALLLAFGTVTLRIGLVALIGGGPAAEAVLPAGSGEWAARVIDVSSPAGSEQRAFVQVRPAPPATGHWLVYAWLPRHPALVPGDEIRVRGTLQVPPADAPGFAGFLESRGAAGTLKGHALWLTGSGEGLTESVEQVRWGADRLLGRAVPEPEAGLASGILIGLRERVSRETADDFTTTGLTHVVAISGWNIALVAGIATAMLRASGLRRRARSAIVLTAIVAYTILAGAEASVIRAAVMGGVVIVARESGSPSGAAAALGLAGWGLLLAQPTMIGDIGLQLSLAATAGLLALGAPAETMVRRLTHGRGPRWLAEALGVSLAAQLSTLPLILLHFGRLSLISPLANLLVAPVVPLAMLGAFAGVLVGAVLAFLPPGPLLAPVMLACWLPLALMTRGAGMLAQVPGANVELRPPADVVGAACALAALAYALRRAHRGRRSGSSPPAKWPSSPPRRQRDLGVGAMAVAAVLVLASTVVIATTGSPALRVDVLDVGQGDAILLETEHGRRLLVDGGPDPDLLVRRLDERIPAWDRRIDHALLTHPHEDHSGGLAGLAPRYSVGRVVETGMNSEGAGVLELRAAAERHGIARTRVVRGDLLPLGDVRVEVLWPPRYAVPDRILTDGRSINGTSVVLSVGVGRQRILLTGDLEDDHDGDILEAIPNDGRRWDLLKVAHHGSATASSRPLLEVLRPRLAAISVGADNRYGHPAATTLERLADADSKIWRTDRQGTLSVAFDGRVRPVTGMLTSEPTPVCRSTIGPALATHRYDPCYARPDGGTHAHRGTLTAHVHLALAASAAARDGGGGGGGVPGLSRRAHGRRGRPPPGRDSRAPPRHRQGPAGGASAARAGPR